MTEAMAVHVRPAESRREVLRCQDLIAQVYKSEYGVLFSADSFDLEAKIEPWPHRYLYGMWQGELVCAVGLYLSNTYVERFGDVSPFEIDALLSRLQATAYSSSRLRELTKLVVAPRYWGRGLARVILGAAHSHAFLQQETSEPAAALSCATLSVYRHLYEPLMSTHRLKDFPHYKVHEQYRSPEDTMESRIVVPDLDIPSTYYEQSLPSAHHVHRKPAGRLRDRSISPVVTSGRGGGSGRAVPTSSLGAAPRPRSDPTSSRCPGAGR